jgi:hypothetical protein
MAGARHERRAIQREPLVTPERGAKQAQRRNGINGRVPARHEREVPVYAGFDLEPVQRSALKQSTYVGQRQKPSGPIAATCERLNRWLWDLLFRTFPA